jgi:hypothetical protein
MTKESIIKRRYKILFKYIDEDENSRTIYYIVKRRKREDMRPGLTLDEIFDLKPFNNNIRRTQRVTSKS